jgi:hypothetical protein
LLLFVGYEIWCVVLHGMLTPISKAGGGTLLPRFFVIGVMRDLLDGVKKVPSEGR